MQATTLARAVRAFEAAFALPPTHAARAPGRVNLIGDHTDYNQGLVLPMAIDRDCLALGRRRTDNRFRVLSCDLEKSTEWNADRSPHAVRDGLVRTGDRWAAYLLGVITMMAERHAGPFAELARGGLDLAVASDVPLGSGLSSSASLEVSVATVLEGLAGKRVSPLEKARACQEAEHVYAGVPCGIMDMLTSAAGLAGHALLIDCKTMDVLPAPLPSPERARVVVINSNARHELAGGEYAQRRAGCERAAMLLGLASLREAQEDPVSMRRLPEELKPLVRHVVSENHRVADAFDGLHRGQFERVGRLMGESHASLRDDYRVSCAELDALVEMLGRIAGVFGARMTGGGFGGSVVALAGPDAVPEIYAEVAERYRAMFGRACTIMKPGASAGAGVVTLG
jgi:galactokinase